MEPFIRQLAELCRTDVIRTKWVIIPSHALGRTLGERIAREGTDWFNLRFVTPLDLAARMGAPFLVERGIDPSEEGLGPALIMRLLLELPPGQGYFRELADQPTLAQAMWTTIREVRLVGLRASDLKPDHTSAVCKACKELGMEIKSSSSGSPANASYTIRAQFLDGGIDGQTGDYWFDTRGVWVEWSERGSSTLPSTCSCGCGQPGVDSMASNR